MLLYGHIQSVNYELMFCSLQNGFRHIQFICDRKIAPRDALQDIQILKWLLFGSCCVRQLQIIKCMLGGSDFVQETRQLFAYKQLWNLSSGFSRRSFFSCQS